MSFQRASDYLITDGEPIVHWRTKGSKNGVRLWQNPDGSYTEAGRNSKPGGRYNTRWEATKAKVAKIKSDHDDRVTEKRAYGTGAYAGSIRRQKGKWYQGITYGDDIARAAIDHRMGKMSTKDAFKVYGKFALTTAAIAVGGTAVIAAGYVGYNNLMGTFVKTVYETTGKSGKFGGIGYGLVGEDMEDYSPEDILKTIKSEMGKATEKTKAYIQSLPQQAREAWVDAKINATTIIPSAKQAIDKLMGSAGLVKDAVVEGVTQAVDHIRNKGVELAGKAKETINSFKDKTDRTSDEYVSGLRDAWSRGEFSDASNLENLDGTARNPFTGEILGLPGTVDATAPPVGTVTDATPITNWVDSMGQRIWTQEDGEYNGRSIIDKAKDFVDSTGTKARETYAKGASAVYDKANDGTNTGNWLKNFMVGLGLGKAVGVDTSGAASIPKVKVDFSGFTDWGAQWTDPKGWAESGGSTQGYKAYREAKAASENSFIQAAKQQYAKWAADNGEFGADGRGIFAEDISDDEMKSILRQGVGDTGYANLVDYWFHNAAT